MQAIVEAGLSQLVKLSLQQQWRNEYVGRRAVERALKFPCSSIATAPPGRVMQALTRFQIQSVESHPKLLLIAEYTRHVGHVGVVISRHAFYLTESPM